MKQALPVPLQPALSVPRQPLNSLSWLLHRTRKQVPVIFLINAMPAVPGFSSSGLHAAKASKINQDRVIISHGFLPGFDLFGVFDGTTNISAPQTWFLSHLKIILLKKKKKKTEKDTPHCVFSLLLQDMVILAMRYLSGVFLALLPCYRFILFFLPLPQKF